MRVHRPLEQQKETAIAFDVKVGLHQGSVLSPLLFVTVMKKRNSAVADKPRNAFRDTQPSKNTVTLKLGLGVTEGHWKCHHSKQRMRLPIDVQ